ncbi:glycosyltransferase [Solilutibacter silvestris]|uniref:Glycosyl transferase group 1 n=1 Tax=Solilutibacter silvestris TaxID=1645665 RepID=A0A2K1Q2H0_9GAMM|nr:glycosyltransferase [Lysobacter silvestris]PNS09232.1 Glycosyl transferase group 1 [Lysobacter silvestris]
MNYASAIIRWQARIHREWAGLALAALRSGNPAEAARITRKALTLARGSASPEATHSSSEKQILIIDRALPDPSLDSGSVRLVEIIRLLGEMGWSVTFIADTIPPAQSGKIVVGGVEFCVDSIGNLPRWLAAHRESLGAVWLSRFQTVLKHAPLIKALAPGVRILFDTVDLHFVRERRRLEIEGNPQANATAARIRRMEVGAASLADTTIVVSEIEGAALAGFAHDVKIAILGNIHVPLPRDRIPSSNHRSGLLFIGGTQHAPNRDALAWLACELFPAIRARLPDIELHVVGAIEDRELAQFSTHGIVFHGHVPNLEPYLSGCRVSVAPLRIGAGVKGKINTAMSHGIPVVATSIAIEGMHLTDGGDVLVGDDAESFAHAVARVYDDAEMWEHFSRAGALNVAEHYSPDLAKTALSKLLSQ